MDKKGSRDKGLHTWEGTAGPGLPHTSCLHHSSSQKGSERPGSRRRLRPRTQKGRTGTPGPGGSGPETGTGTPCPQVCLSSLLPPLSLRVLKVSGWAACLCPVEHGRVKTEYSGEGITEPWGPSGMTVVFPHPYPHPQPGTWSFSGDSFTTGG